MFGAPQKYPTGNFLGIGATARTSKRFAISKFEAKRASCDQTTDELLPHIHYLLLPNIFVLAKISQHIKKGLSLKPKPYYVIS